MAIDSLQLVAMAVTDGANTYDFVFKGNPANYVDDIQTAAGIDVKLATSVELTKVCNVVTPVTSLLEGGYFRRITARGGKKSRQLILPSAKVVLVEAVIKQAGGIDINGATCTSVSNGLKRRTV